MRGSVRILILILSVNLIYSQFTHEFIQTARTDDVYDDAYGVAVGLDGAVFMAGDPGLRAYIYDDTSFTNTTHIDNGYIGNGVAVAADGTVFLANDVDGLRAYSYDGSSFTNTAHIYSGRQAWTVAVGNDGTVFLAETTNGLSAYAYDGSSFTNTAHVDDGGVAYDVTVGPDGTVFLANDGDGLRAYSYDGSSFTNTAHIDDGGRAHGLAVGADGTIFLASSTYGLRAYTYDDSSFTNTAHINDGSGDYYDAKVTVGPNGTIFLATGNDGLRAYTYDDSSFINTAHIEERGQAWNVAVSHDGTVFLADSGGLGAYSYQNSVNISNETHVLPEAFYLYQNYPNPFNPSTTISYVLPEQSTVSLTVYDVQGQEIVTLQNGGKPPGNYEVQWNGMDQSGHTLSTGVYFARLEAGDYSKTIKMLYLR